MRTRAMDVPEVGLWKAVLVAVAGTVVATVLSLFRWLIGPRVEKTVEDILDRKLEEKLEEKLAGITKSLDDVVRTTREQARDIGELTGMLKVLIRRERGSE